MNSQLRKLFRQLAILCLVPNLLCAAAAAQEFYEYRVYRIDNAKNQAVVIEQLKNNLLPALGRLSLDRIGVFTVADSPDDFSVHVLIPFPSLDVLSNLSTKLAQDTQYQSGSKQYFSRTKQTAVYSRIDSKLLKAFAGMPTTELPQESLKKSKRIFEIRTYESAHEKYAELKRQMFNHGETQVMRDVGLDPVFFGETLIGSDYPSLVYMLSFRDMDEHAEAWGKFKVNEGWGKLKVIPKYKGTVSNSRNAFLVPTDFSGI